MICPGPRTDSMSGGSRFIRGLFFLLALSFCLPVFAADEKESKRTILDFPKAYKDSKHNLFPVPFFEADPASGQRYGLMPTMLWMDPKGDVITIAIAALTYNPKVVKLDGFAGLYVYPSPEEKLVLYFETAQNYTRDYYFDYVNENGMNGKLRFENEFEYIADPFERFFGFGPSTSKQAETNFVSHLWSWKSQVAYEILPKLEVQLEEGWQRLLLQPHALTSLADTATVFANNPEVRSSNQWLHTLSLIWDTRDSKDLPLTGNYVEPFLLLSHEPFDNATFYYGYGLRAKKLLTLKDRFTTVVSFKVSQAFGDLVPFYMQPNLGGYKNLRAFVLRRFVGRGRILLSVEERIRVKRWRLHDVNFDLSLDPFISAGQVFNRWGDVALENLQPIGGLGFRARIAPSILGRVDVGLGREGVEVFTALDYPF